MQPRSFVPLRGASVVFACVFALFGAFACGGDKSVEPAAAADDQIVTPADDARLLLLGTGELCESDHGCGKPPIAGACVMGTCFGLLTADSAAARAVLCERLEGASDDVRATAQISLLAALSHPDSGTRARTAAAEGLGAVLAAGEDKACGDPCVALRNAAQSVDPQVSSTACRSLAEIADLTVVDQLLRDLRDGTPHLACATARALAGYAGSSKSVRVRAALTVAAQNGDLAVSHAAKRALRGWEKGA